MRADQTRVNPSLPRLSVFYPGSVFKQTLSPPFTVAFSCFLKTKGTDLSFFCSALHCFFSG